ncbi:WD40 repeat-like protein [Sistotremastrum niveocremeum HHB9708]|uniref:WD40 repeat-like protein n=2 Tax=Sistotremastraceae TaxID=3402574 RepID=A0A164XS05_9AGAM|nr:WD40 repeat-like protein [Sistotremastrum niveocremeum HHB9708]KZT32771.1 WD40 repeat-like protein [Sistotremastrum suecicum HHB10207 ss-3]
MAPANPPALGIVHPVYGPDLTAPLSGTKTPRSESRRSGGGLGQKRKQTLLTLLDALNELTNESTGGSSATGSRNMLDAEGDEPNVDETLQTQGAEAYSQFHRRIVDFDRELRNFANAARQLGSSIGILSSAANLRKRLIHILFLFQTNAAELFPRKVKKSDFLERGTKGHQHHHRHLRIHSKKHPHLINPHLERELDAEEFPLEFAQFAVDLTRFLDCLNEFPEFNDDGLNVSITALDGDLKYWASTLEEFKGQFAYPSVKRYMHDLSCEMGEHFDHITSSLSDFVEVGVPTIRFAQKHGASNLLNLSTVATFFSAVSATTLQFSFSEKGTALTDAVNVFWFSSLVFSIASAVNSLLGLTWKQAMYRSPGHRVPWWVLIWIKRSPLIFLVISVAAFSVGLVLFAYASGQSSVTCTVTTVFTAFSSFGLLAVSLWFASERWAYSRHAGKRWLADVLSEIATDIGHATGLHWLRNHLPTRFRRSMSTCSTYINQLTMSAFASLPRPRRFSNAGDGPGLPFSNTEMLSPSNGMSPLRKASDGAVTNVSGMDASTPGLDDKALPSTSDDHTDEQTPDSPPTPVSPAQRRWKGAVRSLALLKGATAPPPRQATRQMSSMSSMSSPTSDGQPKRDTFEPLGAVKQDRITKLITTFKGLAIQQYLPAHQALVRHLQFSPNGSLLATCSWDRTSHLYKVTSDRASPCTPHRVLLNPTGFVGQVAWSPNGTLLLTKLSRSVRVWTSDGVARKNIERPVNIQSITWMPKGDAFMSVERSEVCQIDLNGNVVAQYRLPRLKIHDVAVTLDSERFLGVATLLESKDGLRPVKARTENRIVVYNLAEKSIESQVPVLHEVRDITLAKSGNIALVSYENTAPPQLWRLDMVHDDVRLVLVHTYMPETLVSWAGSSYFGGKNDQFVICAGKGGDVHIWDRESGAFLHHFGTQDEESGDLTSVAWRPSESGPAMMATATHDGVVKIWMSSASMPAEVDLPQSPGLTGGGSLGLEPGPRMESPIEMAVTEEPIEEEQLRPPSPIPAPSNRLSLSAIKNLKLGKSGLSTR